jgi:ribonuclease D
LTRGQEEDGPDLRETASLCSSIQSVLHDPNIIKAGAGIDNDIMELQKLHPNMYTSCNCRFDIGGITFSSSNSRTSLADLARKILGVRLLKTKATTLSNWSRIPLSTSQINYAAYDAWAAVAILSVLAELDSSIFGANAICHLLKDEPSIQDLHSPKRDNLKYFDISSLGRF